MATSIFVYLEFFFAFCSGFSVSFLEFTTGLLTRVSLLLVISERLSCLELSGTVMDSASVFWNKRLLTFSLERII